MEKQNLIILSYDYPPSTGGVARLCHEITIGLKSFYKTITVITADINGITTPYNQAEAVEIIKVPWQRFKTELEIIKILRKLKNKDSYDVVCGLWHPEGFLAHLAGIKNIYILSHGAELLAGNSKFRKNFWLPIYGKYTLNKAKKVIANSNFTKGLVEKITKKPEVFALPLGVNHTFFSPAKKEKTTGAKLKFCTVARILKFKGHDFILKTLERLPASLQSRIEWHIAGAGPYAADLKMLIEKSPLRKQIKMHGFIADKSLPDFYRDQDVFILATRQAPSTNQVEGFGLVFLEAQACGLPVIGTKTGGIADAIAHENGGWLFKQDDFTSLTTIIKSLLNNPDLVKEQAIKARERVVTKSTWQHYCKSFYKIISE